ncbi:MAG: peptidoglycan DD-metalloendopeptidase family protein [Parcubacteria group bacterium]|nr:peptidoglycan DD-metalloendopeptidase family protein [Parcubacteria group bacterium]
MFGFFKKNLAKYKSYAENDRLVLFVLIASVIILFFFKTTSGQGQDTLLSLAVEEYIEETSALVNLNTEPTDEDFFLSQTISVSRADTDSPLNVFQESFLPYQSLTSIFDNGQRNQVVTYTVQPGDTLGQVANDFGISVNSLIWANNLKDSDYLSPGQELKIPPVSGVIHIVKKGDTIQSIAKKYSANEEKIIEFNGLPKDGSLEISREIIVPDGKIQVAGQYIAYTSNVRFARLPDLGGFFFLPVQGYNWGRIHGRNGVDIANLCGTPVYSAAEGSVIAARESGWNGGAGEYIKISHSNEIYTLYAHLSRLLVSSGEFVSRGQLIGLMGSTGRSTGCHLHFEVHGARNPYARL